jgi:L-lactate dehydrogenase complex protein LldG
VSARDEVLRRVREAVGPSDPAATGQAEPTTRAYRTAGDLPSGSEELDALLVERIEDYRATVHRTGGSDEEIVAAIRSVLGSLGVTSVVCPPAVAEHFLNPSGDRESGIDSRSDNAGPVRIVPDDGSLDAHDLDGIDAVVTGAAVAIAETGTIVLDGGPTCGRRAITLVPDIHVCVVRPDQVVQTVPEALARLEPTRPLTFISGPSATSDIELSRVEGVHGPRTLVVILART